MKNVFKTDWVSDYIWHDNINWRPDHTRNRTLSKMGVIDAFDDGVVTYSDLYIVLAIHAMTYANLYQITEYTRWWKNHNKDLPLNPADDMEAFKSRIETLVKNSFLRRFKFTNNEGKDRDYYYVTPNGYNFIKRKLYFKGSYDEYLGAAPVQEVMKYLANNEILIKVLHDVSVEEGYHIESKPIYSSHIQFFDKVSRSNITTYGFLNIPFGEHKMKILIEPYRPSYDKNVYASGQMKKHQEERFAFLERYINQFNAQNVGEGSLKVIFVAEDIASAKKLGNKLTDFESYVRGNMLITVDKTVEKHGLEDTFIVVKEKDNKFSLGIDSLVIK